MPSLGLVVNLVVVVFVSAFSLWSLARQVQRRLARTRILLRRVRVLGGRDRRPHGLPSLAASPTPNLATTFTTRRTRARAASSSSSTGRGLVPVDTATLLKQAEQSRRGALTSCGGVTADRGASGAPRGDAA